jgi:hypothetical protein
VAINSLLLLHVPPDTALLKAKVAPTYSDDPPVIVPALGNSITLKEAVLLLDTVLLQLDAFVMDVIVTVVEPVLASKPEGTENVPLLAPMVRVAVFPVELFAPPRL